MAAKKKAATKAKATKTAIKKPAAKKTAAKKPIVKAKAPAKKVATALPEAMTKTQILNTIAENTELSRKQINTVFDELADIIERHIKKRAIGSFTLPGLMKIQVTRKPATKARKGINPFTGEETVFKAKPARNVVKIRPLKKVKDMVN